MTLNGRKKVEEYLYTNENGKPLYKTIRYEPKSFSQSKFDKVTGEWINNLDGVKTVLYNLPEVISAVKNNETIFIVEGEKDVNTLKKCNVTATTSPLGAGKWKEHYNPYLLNAIVVIIADNDTVGKSHALKKYK